MHQTYCSKCFNISDTDPCTICGNPKRDETSICVVEDVRDVIAMERTHEFNGVYHVLHGSISPMNGIGPDDIKIKELLARITPNTKEVILLFTLILKAPERFPANAAGCRFLPVLYRSL